MGLRVFEIPSFLPFFSPLPPFPQHFAEVTAWKRIAGGVVVLFFWWDRMERDWRENK
jgi:hypothetical protein